MTEVPESIKIKRELYNHVINQIWQRWGRVSSEILSYKKRYDFINHRPWKISNSQELLNQIDSAQVIVLGDFHSLNQSQKSHLRILKKIENKNIKIGIECLYFQHQVHLDDFLKGEIDENEFLNRIDWKKNWGFPWENFREIFLWAKKHEIPMIALNDLRHRNVSNSLQLRDLTAAKIISHELQKDNRPIFVIYGETHLASDDFFKIKSKKKKKINVLKVFQNIDEIYFELMDLNKEDDIDVVKFSASEYCVMNIPPWVKWQSYLMFLEKKYDHELDGENIDFTDYVAQYIKIISAELRLKISSKNLSVYTASDFSFLKIMKKKLNKNLIAFYETLIEEERAFYIPQLGIGYLGRATINQAASLAMQYIYFQVARMHYLKIQLPKNFLSLIWIESISYFGSKIVNPKRKTETIKDIKNKILLTDSQDQRKEALKLALFQKTKELMILSGRKYNREIMPVKKKSSYVQCANLLGSILGEKLYNGYKKKKFNVDFIQGLLKKKVTQSAFDLFYYEMIENIESLPELFRSKSDKL